MDMGQRRRHLHAKESKFGTATIDIKVMPFEKRASFMLRSRPIMGFKSALPALQLPLGIVGQHRRRCFALSNVPPDRTISSPTSLDAIESISVQFALDQVIDQRTHAVGR
ncbi:hypothetical protein H261_20784 [Paramagnetospirillum caucaseum]|uniref:Uncharacterized protein n=1 Tax=Paramagnetospirillum caucaseum TaxID=1244869 RepID=M2Z114_9PROT|nr:hypothetical protein H261_20784 [Paramagnetospirillum caucaseum]